MKPGDIPDQCPFCGAKKHNPPFDSLVYRCGTRSTNPETSEYITSTWCDKEVFRDGFMRCRAIIDRLARLNSPVVSRTLWEAIKEENQR